MINIKFFPYKIGSESIKNLISEFNTMPEYAGNVAKYKDTSPFTTRLQNHGYRPFNEKNVFIKWGNAILRTPPEVHSNLLTFNCHTPLKQFINKKTFFENFSSYERLLPKFLSTPEEINHYQLSFPANTTRPIIVERHILDGHSGVGIRLLGVNDEPDFVNGKLWVAYIPKEREFRVHFFKTGVKSFNLLIAEKLLRKADEASVVPNRYQIRNHHNGWIYATEHNNPIPYKVLRQAKRFASLSNLDFGAIDLIYNKTKDEARVLEVNTAPGITRRTTTWYAQNFITAINNHQWDTNSTKFFNGVVSLVEANADDLIPNEI